MRLFIKVVNQKLDDTFLESKLNRYTFYEDEFTFKDLMIDKNQFDTAHEVVKLLITGERTKRINRFRVFNQPLHIRLRKIAFLGDSQNHVALRLRKVLVSFS